MKNGAAPPRQHNSQFRSVISDGEQQQLRDLQQPYLHHFDLEKVRLSQDNGLKWNVFPEDLRGLFGPTSIGIFGASK
jgi:hypothetical protein